MVAEPPTNSRVVQGRAMECQGLGTVETTGKNDDDEIRTSTTSGRAAALPIVKRSVAQTAFPDVFRHLDGGGSDGSSTSAGSRATCSADDDDDNWGIASPINWRTRNTFIDSPFAQPTLLQGFQARRRSFSVPAGGREASERAEGVLPSALESDEDALAGEQTTDDASCPSSPSNELADTELDSDVPAPPLALALADLVAAPGHGSRGSALHHQGTCKPCAFFWKVVGCQSGSDCEFCHLCDADERKRRNKVKRMAIHAMQTAGRTQGLGESSRQSRGGKSTDRRVISIA